MELHVLGHTWIGAPLDWVTFGLGHTWIGSHQEYIRDKSVQPRIRTVNHILQNVGQTRFQDLNAHGRESQEDTGVDFDIALIPDKNLLHDPLRNCNQAQL